MPLRVVPYPAQVGESVGRREGGWSVTMPTTNGMLTNITLRAQVDALWDKLWSGGLSNPLDAIEQLSFLLFLKRLDEREDAAARVKPVVV